MSKAVLVIDMPKSCADCDIRFTDEYTDWCPVNIEENQTDIFDYANNFTKPDWCPLKAIPEKKTFKYTDYYSKGELGEALINALEVDIWNNCIDEILGE